MQVAQLASHAPHTVFAAMVHADVSYLSAAQTLHTLQVEPARYLPPLQLVHWAAPEPVQVAQLA